MFNLLVVLLMFLYFPQTQRSPANFYGPEQGPDPASSLLDPAPAQTLWFLQGLSPGRDEPIPDTAWLHPWT